MKKITVRDQMGGMVFQVKEKNGIFTVLSSEEFGNLKVEIRDDKNHLVVLTDDGKWIKR